MIVLKGCPRCQGAVTREQDRHGVWLVCLVCGWERALWLDTLLAEPRAKRLA